MNTKNCPSCGQTNPIQQAFCHNCGNPFPNPAPNNFGGQANYQNQPVFNQPNYTQQPVYPSKKSGSKAVWWILGGVLGLLIIGFIGLVGLGFLAVAVHESEASSSSSSTGLARSVDAKWKSPATGDTLEMWDKNHRYAIYDNGTGTTEKGSYTIIDENSFQLNSDKGNSIVWSVSINGNTMIISNPTRGKALYNKVI